MTTQPLPHIELRASIEAWPLAEPFHISGYVFELVNVLVVELEQDGLIGRGEAAGVYYLDDRPEGMLREVERVREALARGIGRDALQTLLPAGGARNALDCALWDLEAKLSGTPVWALAGLETPKPLLTTFTCAIDTPERMAARAQYYTDAQALKLKLSGDALDADRVRAVREVCPDHWIGIDANQGFTPASLERLMPCLIDTSVSLIEQPFPVGRDAWLDGFVSPIPLAADESVQTRAELHSAAQRYTVINIKLDKCGGLTEGLAMARMAKTLGLAVMTGNMMGTSLAMAPGFLCGQLSSVVDLDGPVYLINDRFPPTEYRDGKIWCPESLWGGA